MYTITPRTRIQEGVSQEEEDCYETGYEICDEYGEIIYDFANKDIKTYYERLNELDEEDIINTTNANITNLADDIIDIFEELLDRLDIFEELLDRLDITLPDKWREGEEDEARIFGDTYYELESKIIERLDKEVPKDVKTERHKVVKDCANSNNTDLIDYNPSDVDWVVGTNEIKVDTVGNLVLDHKAAFNFKVDDIITVGFCDDFGDITEATKCKIIKNDRKHLVCKFVE